MKCVTLALAGLCLAIIAVPATTAASGPIALEWQALAPENWEAPLILPAPEADGHYPVDPDSLVQQFDGQEISLAGYMVPVRFQQNVVTEFLYVPFLGHHVQGHAHYDANQMIYVRLSEPVTVVDPFAAWFVQGVLRVASVTTEDGRTGYTLEQARAEQYNAEQHDNHAQGQPDY